MSNRIQKVKERAKYVQYVKFCNEGLQEPSLTKEERVNLEEAKEMYLAAIEQLDESLKIKSNIMRSFQEDMISHSMDLGDMYGIDGI